MSATIPGIKQLQQDFFVVRSVRDAANLLAALRGAVGESVSTMEMWRELPGHSGPQKRVLVTNLDGDSEPGAEVEDAVRRIAHLLSELGYAVAPAPPLPQTRDLLLALDIIWNDATAQIVSKVEEWTGRSATTQTLEPRTLARVRAGRKLHSQQIADARATIRKFRIQMEQFSSMCDFLVSPTVPIVAPPVGLYDPSPAADSGTYHGSAIARLEAFTTRFNTSGQPAISLPLAKSSEGLPIGIQVAGRRGADYELLAVSADLERAMPSQSARPRVYAGTVI